MAFVVPLPVRSALLVPLDDEPLLDESLLVVLPEVLVLVVPALPP
jgi:hypothetical protein